MIIYHDILTGDELFSDNFPLKLVCDGLLYEVEGKIVAESTGDIDESLIGGNKSAEEPAAEEYSAGTKYGCNIVLNHRLVEVATMNKKDYMTLIKPYVKDVLGKLKESSPERVEEFQKGAMNAIKHLKAMWDDLVPYRGESMDESGMMAFMNYREDGDPYMIFFKDGLREQKV